MLRSFLVIFEYLMIHFSFFNLFFSDQIRVTVKGFFSFNIDSVKMKNHLRDFLVQIKVNFISIRYDRLSKLACVLDFMYYGVEGLSGE